MRQKNLFIICLLLTSLFLVGWGKKEVSLLDSNKLIDLNKAIEIAKPGGVVESVPDGSDTEIDSISTESEIQEIEPSIQETELETEEQSNEETTPETTYQELPKIFIVQIHGQEITIDGEELGINEIKEHFYQEYKPKTSSVVLIDDFAESETYKDVKQILDELYYEIGLRYSEGQ